MRYRRAALDDAPLLAQLNHQLIGDEGHTHPMSVPGLETRMRTWLAVDYEAVIFGGDSGVLAYALYREDADEVYLRQFYVARGQRRRGVGRRAMGILRHEIWPPRKRLLVEVLCHNEPAIQFWRAVGFREYSLAMEMPPESSTAGS